MRWLVLLAALGGCDRVFGLGDPYEDAHSIAGSGDAAADGDGGHSSSTLIADFELDANFNDAVSRNNAICTRLNGSLCGFSQGHDGSGGSALFDGGTCVTFDLPTNPTALSIALWVKPTSGVTQTLIARPYASSTDKSWLLEEDNDSLYFQSYSGSLTLSSVSTPGITDTNWHFLVVTIDPTTSTFYLDGAARLSTAGITIGYGGNTTVDLGCDILTSSFDNLSGQLDNVKIFDGILTPQEVMQLGM